MAEFITKSYAERVFLFLLRVSVGWEFLWAAIHHFGDDSYVHGFLSHTKTFHPIYGVLADSSFLPVISFVVEYGHLLLGLSLISGLLVRVSAPFGILVMLTYWTAHMDFPYIGDVNSLIIDYHITNALVLALVYVTRAGHFWGLDAWASGLPVVQGNDLWRRLTA